MSARAAMPEHQGSHARAATPEQSHQGSHAWAATPGQPCLGCYAWAAMPGQPCLGSHARAAMSGLGRHARATTPGQPRLGSHPRPKPPLSSHARVATRSEFIEFAPKMMGLYCRIKKKFLRHFVCFFKAP